MVTGSAAELGTQTAVLAGTTHCKQLAAPDKKPERNTNWEN